MSGCVVGLLPALNSMLDEAPSALLDTVNFFAARKGAPPYDEKALVEALNRQGVNDEIRIQFQILVARWDAVTGDDASWAEGTRHHTAERRAVIYRALAFTEPSWPTIEAVYPPDPAGVVIEARDKDWHHWYTAQRRAGHDFYWKAYSDLLAREGWAAPALGRLDTATTAVVERLADPTWEERFQSRGLVVGYVQSGKTANFTGVVAKAIDAGFRLVIVLTGTVEILRQQTQRRLDMELIGVENILVGRDENDPVQFAETDYHGDTDWHDGRFLRHGVEIGNLDEVPAVHRLSTYNGDYKRLQQGLAVLDFRAGNQLKNKLVPLYRPENLLSSDVRIAVVKKNSTVLKKLVADLRGIRANLGEIPTLIIDDEADQASVNTRKPRLTPKEKQERTAVNRQISELLRVLSRAQYIGYTATPFANVFVDPDDSEDIFPKDFILALERPDGYMGAADFHDLGVDYGDQAKTIHNSNEKAYVRDLTASVDDEDCWREEMQGALDAFVLSGAIKLYRQSVRPNLRFQHHTMLVHESVNVADHADLANRIREIWRRSGYDTQAGTARLRKLFDEDYSPVAAALLVRARGRAASEGKAAPDAMPLPATFDELVDKIGLVLGRIEKGRSPVIVVNGSKEKDYEQDELNFQTGDVWKILVGGAKLSRGFTVEGLTISYYTRRTGQADSLMQMGRWFGFRRGYHDLVRLHIGRNVRVGTKTYDLYEAFQAIVEDEEDFRAELRRYSEPTPDGLPGVRPEDVPPMVFQQLPWLKPTSTSKMYNAELVRQGAGGKVEDFTLLPDRGDGSRNARNLAAVLPLISALTSRAEFQHFNEHGRPGHEVSPYQVRFGVVPAQVVYEVMSGLIWLPGWDPRPSLRAVHELIEDGILRDFVVFVPLLQGAAHRRPGDHPMPLPVINTSRRKDRPGFNGSSPRQRDAMRTIAGVLVDGPSGTKELDTRGGPYAVGLHAPTRGAVLLNLALDTGPAGPKNASDLPDPVPAGDVATLISYALPFLAKSKIGFKVKKSDAGAIIQRDAQR
ncbi:Z1 domain-containing protein [Pseudofrankia inefficax]|uniref:Putative endonuclease, Z1 domain protein n=1 Tax=Pseudofrankia inefficax (strain DSM 45817 / CECT 9037 / DDB 130130 / EuI1c) TaxID=298654 RepID=E3JC93_PSEI1|nr:Z1 domain-containing protein [Pseudofrankia inefficax]ADP84682.1 Putative endonuclease, Z1 domain protein [Pseudofrankia inefficax]